MRRFITLCFLIFTLSGVAVAQQMSDDQVVQYVKDAQKMGKTQKQMGEELGIKPQSYSAKENGKRAFKDNEKKIIKNMISVLFPDITYEDLFF